MTDIPHTTPPFDGKIARLYADAEPRKLQLEKRGAGAPNILLAMNIRTSITNEYQDIHHKQ